MWQQEFQRIFLSKTLLQRALQGATIAFVLIVTLIIAVSGKDPDYELWMLVPISTVSFGGACGGVFFFVMELLRINYRWKKFWVTALSVLVYIVGLYLSLVLGLAFTGHWD